MSRKQNREISPFFRYLIDHPAENTNQGLISIYHFLKDNKASTSHDP